MSNSESIRRDRSALLAELEQAGANVSGPTEFCCPFHNDRNPSAGIFQGDDDVWRFKCHGCGAGGDVFDLRARNTGQPLADVLKAAKGQTGKHKHLPNAERSGCKTSPTRDSTIATVVRKIGGTHWAAEECGCIDAMDDDRLTGLAGQLGVSPAALRAIGCGWHESQQCFTFPERDGDGNVIGVATRGLDRRKGFLPGGQRGLTVPGGLDDRPDPLLIVEGATDVAACLTHGIAAVGRPNHSGGVDHLATLIQERPVGRDVIVVGENDAKAKDGSWPGRVGAIKVATELTRRLGREIKWAMPPDKVKDVREWLNNCKLDLSDETACKAAGRKLVGQLASDSFRPPIESRDGRNEYPDPIPASALSDGGGEIEFVWKPYLALGHKTLLSAHPKDGKTTLLAHVVKAMEQGGHLVGPIAKGRVLIVTEESRMLWNERRKKLGLGDHVEFYFRFQVACNTPAQWEKLIAKIASLVRERDYALVIFDTFANVCALDDENDAAKMNKALRPLDEITEAGAAVLLIHHTRKGKAAQVQGSRGSSALTGFVDVVVQMERHKPSQAEGCCRVLKALSRFDETPPETVIELRDGHYVALGDKVAASRYELVTVIQEVLPNSPPGLLIDDILDKWPSNGIPKPGKSRLRTVLNDGFTQGKWQREGKGRKGSPYRFYLGSQKPKDSFRPGLSPIGGRNESGNKAGSDG